jgi:20S proteasome alpha/beta subunit
LVSKVYEMQDELRRTYGIATPTPMQVATAIATACQRHSFGGGLRPYGSTICVLSSNEILQTDPSGAITIFDDDDTTTTNNNVHVVGSKHALALRRKLQDEETPKSLAEALQLAAKHLLLSNNNDDKEKIVWLEVMIVSKSKGIYKLSEEQVERLVESVTKASSSS